MKFVFASILVLGSSLVFAKQVANSVERIQPVIQAEDLVIPPQSVPEAEIALKKSSTAVEMAKTQIKESAKDSIKESTAKESAAREISSEADIPLKLVDSHRSNNVESPWMRMLYSLLIIAVMAAVSFFYIKRKKAISKTLGTAPEIKMLRQFHLGPKKSLAIIHVAGESILIGVTDQSINLIKGLSLIDDEVPTQTPIRFNDALDDSEEFSIKGIQDVVSQKLKTMRSLQ